MLLKKVQSGIIGVYLRANRKSSVRLTAGISGKEIENHMNQVSQATVGPCDDSTGQSGQYTATRKRPKKSLRNNTASSNLLAFASRETAVAVPPVTKRARPATRINAPLAPATPTATNQHVAARRTAVDRNNPESGSDRSAAATAASRLGFVESTSGKLFAGVALIGIGLTWITIKTLSSPPAVQTPVAQDNPDLDPVAIGIASVEKPELDLPIGEPKEISSAGSFNTPLAKPEDAYLEEIDWLNTQNHYLQVEVDVLSQEALDLNSQLLDMELQLVKMSQPADPDAEPQIVYSFVDVPLGGSISPESDNTQQTQSIEYQSIQLQSTPPESTLPGEDQPELGNQLLAYDPETGFHRNSQFDEGGDTGTEDILGADVPQQQPSFEKIDFPPIAPGK